MNEIKLKTKQLAVLQQIQAEKTQLSKAFQTLNEKESLLLEIIFEANDIATSQIKNVKLEGDSLTYDYIAEPESKTKKIKKAIKQEA